MSSFKRKGQHYNIKVHLRFLEVCVGVCVCGGGGGGERFNGDNFGTGEQASISKPTTFIYLAFEKKPDPFIY